jgi:hypothetical protein
VNVVCHPGLDPGSSGFRLIWHIRSLEDGCRGLPGGNSLSFASPKESKQRKGDPLHRPFGVPKISRQQRAARKLVARGGAGTKDFGQYSPLKQCERTAPVAGAKFWRSNMGNSTARLSTVTSCASLQKTTVILSNAEGSAFLSASHVINLWRKLGPRTSAWQKTSTLHPGKGSHLSTRGANPIIHGHLQTLVSEDAR